MWNWDINRNPEKFARIDCPMSGQKVIQTGSGTFLPTGVRDVEYNSPVIGRFVVYFKDGLATDLRWAKEAGLSELSKKNWLEDINAQLAKGELVEEDTPQRVSSVPETFDLVDFIRESNRIERIYREPTFREIEAHQLFLDNPGPVTVATMEDFVREIQPDAVLRRQVGQNVMVGSHLPPFGGPEIAEKLQEILARVNFGSGGEDTVYHRHIEYETLHPFTDGNGRSGRALWLYDMGGMLRAPLGFLHTWYYQSLANADMRKYNALRNHLARK